MHNRTLLVPLAGLTAATAATCSSSSSTTTDACTTEALNALLPPTSNATTLFAIPLPANSTFGQAGDIAYPQNATSLPAACAALVNVTSSPSSSYTFGLFLPTTQQWNHRTLTVGNGGFMGGVNWLAMGDGLKYGFASMSTDTGHNSTGIDMAWALGHPEAKTDWAYRALHGSVEIMKTVVEGYYYSDNGGNSTTTGDEEVEEKRKMWNYYSGCSTGGRQGIKSAQDFPGDFDGVLAGAPAWWSTHQQLWQLKVGAVNLPEASEGYIPQKMFGWLSDAVLEQCDGQDGVVDKIIQDPGMCRLQLGKMLCDPQGNGNSSECLTAAQAETLRQLYTPMVETDASADKIEYLYPNFGIGSEKQMPSSFGTEGTNQPSRYGTDYAKYYIYDDPSWDWEVSFNYSAWKLAGELNPGNVNALKYDMSEFSNRGGKLLTYHGWADGLIPSGASTLLYDNVELATAAAGNGAMDDWYRLFMVPGMQHCQGSVYDAPWYFGGSGHPSSVRGSTSLPLEGASDRYHDALLALMAWVEEKQSPQYLIATKWDNDTLSEGIVRQRPLCRWPGRAVYDGKGDVNAAESWKCTNV